MKLFSISLTLFLFLFVSCSDNKQQNLIVQSGNNASLFITNVNVFNGKDSALIMNVDVIIQDQKIVSISKNKKNSDNNALNIVDGTGKTLMPGMIDAHVHLSGNGAVPWAKESTNEAYNLACYLYSGITTVYDLGGIGSDLEKLANKVENGQLLGPSIYHTHIPITIENSHPIPLTQEMLNWPLNKMVNMIAPTINDKSEAGKLIQSYLKNEVDYVKVICDQIPPKSPQMSFEVMQAVIKEAKKVGMKTFVHIGSPENAIDAAKAGADVLAHGIWRGKLTQEQAEILKQYNVPMIFTVAALQNVNEIYHGEFHPSELDQKLVPPSILRPVSDSLGKDVRQQPTMNAFFADVSKYSSHLTYNLQLIQKAGIPILVGTDSNLPGTYAGSTYLQEIYALKAIGLSNFEILRAATYLNSKLFIDSPNFGTVEMGQNADLLLLNGNPLQDLKWLSEPKMIIKNGRIVERNS